MPAYLVTVTQLWNIKQETLLPKILCNITEIPKRPEIRKYAGLKSVDGRSYSAEVTHLGF